MEYKTIGQEKMSIDEDGTGLKAIEPAQEDPEKTNSRKLQSRHSTRQKSIWQRVTFNLVPLVDKSKLFSHVRPIIYQRKSSSSSERLLNSRLLKIIQSTLKKIFKIAEWFQRIFLESGFKFIYEICTQENV